MSQPENPSSSGAKRTRRRTGESTGSTFTRHPVAWVASALGLAFVLAGTGALFAGAAVGAGATSDTPGPIQSAAPERARPDELPLSSGLRTCSVAALAADPALGGFAGAVVNATTGEVLFDRAATTAVPQGDVMNILTASAALSILGPELQLTTRVYESSSENTIVLVGGGDPTISALHSGDSVYPGAPKLDDLAAQVISNYSGDIEDVENIVLDSTLWNAADKWDAGWPRAEQTKGTLSEVTALQVDGDRQDPTAQVSPRSTDPITRAGVKFAEALGLDADEVTFSLGSAITSKPLLGSVNSQPVSVLVNQMLVSNDRTLAESLARVTSKTMGQGGSSASLQTATTQALGIYAVDITGLAIRDGSGVSAATAAPPRYVAGLMAKVLSGGQNLSYVYNSLAVAGKSGSLAKRFVGTPLTGQVFGSAGRSGAGHDLAGAMTAADGTQLAFAFYAPGAVKDTAKPALDALVTGVYACGANLSNN